jgi:NADH-quinone oxidoreductase subunit N
MLSLVILFLSAITTMFVSFFRIASITLFTALIGLFATGTILYCQWLEPSNFLSSYEGVKFDNLTVFFSITAVIFTILIVITSYDSFKNNFKNNNDLILSESSSKILKFEYLGDYIGLFMLSLFGAILMVSFNNLFLFFLGLEIMSIPIYVMAGAKKHDPLSSEASLKYFITGAFTTGILLFGIAWLYGATGSFNLSDISNYFYETEKISSMAYIGIIMILSAFLFKIGAVPFHFWSPDVYDGSAGPVTAYMAAVIKLCAFGAFIRLFFVFSALYDFWMPLIAFISILTMFVGNLSAIRQNRFKRLIAYSSIAHVGYSLITLVVMTNSSALNLWFYLFSYGFATILLITVQIIINDIGDRIESFKGLAYKNSFLGFSAVVGLLALAGVPPLIGFFGKYIIFADAIWTNPAIVAVALLNSGIGIYYYLRIVIIILQKPSIVDNETNLSTFKVSLLQSIVIIICLIALIFGGLLLLI